MSRGKRCWEPTGRFRGGYRNLGGVAATVTAERPLPVHVDGDPSAPAARIEVALCPHALRIVVPAAVASDPAGPFAQGSAQT